MSEKTLPLPVKRMGGRLWLFGALSIICMIIVGVVLGQIKQQHDDAVAAQNATAVAQAKLAAAKPIVKALKNYADAPVTYMSDEYLASIRSVQSANANMTREQAAARVAPSGIKITPDAKTWHRTGATTGTIRAAVQFSTYDGSSMLTFRMVYEAGLWKVAGVI